MTIPIEIILPVNDQGAQTHVCMRQSKFPYRAIAIDLRKFRNPRKKLKMSLSFHTEMLLYLENGVSVSDYIQFLLGSFALVGRCLTYWSGSIDDGSRFINTHVWFKPEAESNFQRIHFLLNLFIDIHRIGDIWLMGSIIFVSLVWM